MGLREVLTKPMGFGSAEFSWNEPTLYRIRLRGDIWLRVAVVLGTWGAGTGLLWALFANNPHRPGLLLGLALGALPAGLAFLFLFFLRDHVSGRVSVEKSGLRRTRSFAGITSGSWHEWQEWPWAAISRCSIVPAATGGKSFSVLLLASGDERDIIGIPGSIDLHAVAKYLTSRGVSVTTAKGIPPQFSPRLPLGVAAAFPAAGALALIGGLVYFVSARGEVAGPPEVIQRPPAPGFARHDPGIPPLDRAPPNPAAQFDPALAASDGAPLPPGTRQTEAFGGPGGYPFVKVHPELKPVTGIRTTFGQWAGKPYIKEIDPLFGGEPEEPDTQEIKARPGYVVAGLLVDAPELFGAYAVVFKKLTPDGRLDPADSYISEWIGTKPAQPRALDGAGAKVVGVSGRGGAVIDAISLVLKDQ